MIAFSTGNAATLECRVCGLKITHDQTTNGNRQWWSARKHAAPCGAPCIGGGVRPKDRSQLVPGASGISHAHRTDRCGTPECKGGRS